MPIRTQLQDKAMPKQTSAEAAEEFNKAVKSLILTVCKELRLDKIVDWLSSKLSSKSLK